MIKARAKLLCAICSHEWQLEFVFANFQDIEAHDYTKQKCPKCGERHSVLLPIHDSGADTFGNPIDPDDKADDWKRA